MIDHPTTTTVASSTTSSAVTMTRLEILTIRDDSKRMNKKIGTIIKLYNNKFILMILDLQYLLVIIKSTSSSL